MALGLGPATSRSAPFGKALIRLAPVTAGSIVYQGQDLGRLSSKQFMSYRKRIQMIFQDPYASLNPRMSVGEMPSTS